MQNLTSVRYSDYVPEYALNEHFITSSLHLWKTGSSRRFKSFKRFGRSKRSRRYERPVGPKGLGGPEGPRNSRIRMARKVLEDWGVKKVHLIREFLKIQLRCRITNFVTIELLTACFHEKRLFTNFITNYIVFDKKKNNK